MSWEAVVTLAASGAAVLSAAAAVWAVRVTKTSDRSQINREATLTSLKNLDALLEEFVDVVGVAPASVDHAYIAVAKASRELDYTSRCLRDACHKTMIAAGDVHSAVKNSLPDSAIEIRVGRLLSAWELLQEAGRAEMGIS